MKLPSLALAGALALSAAGASLAQPAPAPDAGPRHEWPRPDPAKMAEEHAQRLRAVLQLRPDQEPALKALIAAMQPDPAKMEQRRAEREAMRNLTTPQRLDRMQARMAERQQQFGRRAEAIKRFYAQLSPAQQKAFDALRPPGGHMGGDMGDHGRGFGHGKHFGPGGLGGEG